MLVCRKSREGGEVKHKNIKFSGKHRRRCETQDLLLYDFTSHEMDGVSVDERTNKQNNNRM